MFISDSLSMYLKTDLEGFFIQERIKRNVPLSSVGFIVHESLSCACLQSLVKDLLKKSSY